MVQAAEVVPVRLLVVEDNRDICDNIAGYLEKHSYVLDFAYDGISAMYLALTQPFDVIVLDVMMPGMDGPETLKQLRTFPALADTPVVFMTAKVQPQEVQGYLNLGALGVIAKPFDPMTLAEQLRAIWRMRFN